jgi:hypothetical protein
VHAAAQSLAAAGPAPNNTAATALAKRTVREVGIVECLQTVEIARVTGQYNGKQPSSVGGG